MSASRATRGAVSVDLFQRQRIDIIHGAEKRNADAIALSDRRVRSVISVLSIYAGSRPV